MVLSDLVKKLQTLPPHGEVLLKDADGNFCDVDEIRGGEAFDGDFLVVLEGKPFIQIKGGKQRVVVKDNAIQEPATANIIQEGFDHYIKSIYPEPPKEGSAQYEQLRNAYFGGCNWTLAQDDGSALVPELLRYLEAKKMNIEFGGDKS
jgi:hypothetical protein